MTLKQLMAERDLHPQNIESVEDQLDCEMHLIGTVEDGLHKSDVWMSENLWGIGLWSAGSSILTVEQVEECQIEINEQEARPVPDALRQSRIVKSALERKLEWLQNHASEETLDAAIKAVVDAAEIDVEYNTNGNHEATASAFGVSRTCFGLSACGEAHFSDDVHPEYLSEALADAAYERIKKEWNYDGSNWSEPVDEPNTELMDEPSDTHRWEIAMTSFHGGRVIGYAECEEDAEAWIEFKNQKTDCTCGCYECRYVGDGKDESAL